MSPDQLESMAKAEEKRATSHFHDAEKARSEAQRIQSEIDKTRQNAEISIKTAYDEAEKKPEEADSWSNKAEQDQHQLDMMIDKMQREMQSKLDEAESYERKGAEEHHNAEELQEKKRRLQAVLLAADAAADQDQRAA